MKTLGKKAVMRKHKVSGSTLMRWEKVETLRKRKLQRLNQNNNFRENTIDSQPLNRTIKIEDDSE